MFPKLATHDGGFHCDEVLAFVMLKQLPEYKNATLVRTRNSDVLATCDVVFDVGNEYDLIITGSYFILFTHFAILSSLFFGQII